MGTRTPSRAIVAASCAAALLLLAACGGGGDGSDAAEDAEDAAGTTERTEQASETGDAADLTVLARDIEFDAAQYSASAGEVRVRYVNEGSLRHTLAIEEVDGVKLEVEANGDADRATVELEPGDYTIYCDVPGHRDAGMEATLTVS